MVAKMWPTCTAILEAARIGNNVQGDGISEKNGDQGLGDTPNQHDILTGSTATAAYTDAADHVQNWTSGSDGTANGHFDRTGGGNTS
jgi:hypothetical protein